MNADDFMDTVDAAKRSQDKDAEIERLKAEWHAEIERSKRYSEAQEKAFLLRTAVKDQLITELCDALSSCNPGWPNYWKEELIQRAREATR